MLVSRRHFFLGSLALPALAGKKQAPPRPSVVLILVDELPGWMLGAYGNKEVLTPNIDRLGNTGTRFVNHFAASPDPACSKATLLTGRTPMQIGDAGTLSSADIGLSQMLGALGYNCQATAQGAASAAVTAEAVKFLDQQTADKNFFLTVHYTDLRAPYDGVPAKFLAPYTPRTFTDYAQDRPAANAREGKEMLGNTLASLIKAAGAISALDAQIGEVIAKLYQKQLMDGSMIVFTSTAGALMGRHGLWGAGEASDPPNMYDEVVNTPIIWVWPTRIPPQGMEVEMVSAYDLVPTIADFVNVDPPNRNLCGISYLRLATAVRQTPKEKRKNPWRKTVCGHWKNTDMAREIGYKVVLRDGGKGHNELYDIPSDRVERVNQYDNPQYVEVKNRLEPQIAAWKAKYSS